MNLPEAYELVEKAEKLYKERKFRDASRTLIEASDAFKKLSKQTTSSKMDYQATEALALIAQQQTKRAIEIIYQSKLKKVVDTRNNESKKSTGKVVRNTKNTALNGEYSIINAEDNWHNNKLEPKSNANAIQQGIMTLFDLFAIDPNFDDTVDDKSYTPSNDLRGMTKAELIQEGEKLRKTLFHKNKIVETFKRIQNSAGARGDRSQMVLIDKTMFNDRLGAFLQANSKFTSSQNRNGTSTNSSTASNSANASLSSFSARTPVSNQLIAEKEAEIKRLQYYHAAQERQVQTLTQRLRTVDKEREKEKEQSLMLQKEISRLESRLKQKRSQENETGETHDLNYQYEKLASERNHLPAVVLPRDYSPTNLLQSDDDDDDDDDDEEDEEDEFGSSSEIEGYRKASNGLYDHNIYNQTEPVPEHHKYVSSFRR